MSGKTLTEMQEERIKWEKERIKLQDERTAYRRTVRDQARRETFAEQVAKRAAEADRPLPFKPSDLPERERTGECDVVAHLTDLHAGIGISNNWNSYSEEVMINRLCEYLQQVCDVQVRHKAENAYVILGGDLISGGIHATIRIENNQDVIDQILTVSELLAQVLAEMSRMFSFVHVYLTPGNHGRIQANKDLDLAHENLDNLILPYLEAKLQNYPTVICHNNDIEQSVAVFTVRGNLIYASHGDRDRYKTAAQRLTMMFGKQPDLIYLGHMHHNSYDTQAGTKVIQSGCLSGPDQYCVDKRIPGKPEQTVSVITEKGLLCLYDVRFSV